MISRVTWSYFWTLNVMAQRINVFGNFHAIFAKLGDFRLLFDLTWVIFGVTCSYFGTKLVIFVEWPKESTNLATFAPFCTNWATSGANIWSHWTQSRRRWQLLLGMAVSLKAVWDAAVFRRFKEPNFYRELSPRGLNIAAATERVSTSSKLSRHRVLS